MKKTIAIAVSALLLVSLAACTGAAPSSLAPASTGSASSLPPAGSAPGGIGNTLTLSTGVTVEFLYDDFSAFAAPDPGVVKTHGEITLEGDTLYYQLNANGHSTLHKKDLASGADTALYQCDERLYGFLVVDEETILLFFWAQDHPGTDAYYPFAFDVEILDLPSGAITSFTQEYSLEERFIYEITYTDGVFYVSQEGSAADNSRLSVIDRSGTVRPIAEPRASFFTVSNGCVYYAETIWSDAGGSATLYTASAQDPTPTALLRVDDFIDAFSVVGTQCGFRIYGNSAVDNSNFACIDLSDKTITLDFSFSVYDTIELTEGGYFQMARTPWDGAGVGLFYEKIQLSQYDLAGNLVQAFPPFELDGPEIVLPYVVHGNTVYYLVGVTAGSAGSALKSLQAV